MLMKKLKKMREMKLKVVQSKVISFFILLNIFLLLLNFVFAQINPKNNNLDIRIEFADSNRYSELNTLLRVDVYFYITDTNTYYLSKRISWDTQIIGEVLVFELFIENENGNYEKTTPSDNVSILTLKDNGYWMLNSNLIVKKTYPINSIYKFRKGKYLLRAIYNTECFQIKSNFITFSIH